MFLVCNQKQTLAEMALILNLDCLMQQCERNPRFVNISSFLTYLPGQQVLQMRSFSSLTEWKKYHPIAYSIILPFIQELHIRFSPFLMKKTPTVHTAPPLLVAYAVNTVSKYSHCSYTKAVYSVIFKQKLQWKCSLNSTKLLLKGEFMSS